MEYVTHKRVPLRSHPLYNEKWLQHRIAEDTSLLGLGDLDVKDLERSQPRAGRLDMLLFDPETSTRYEVELQLGSTDESTSSARSSTGTSSGAAIRSTTMSG